MRTAIDMARNRNLRGFRSIARTIVGAKFRHLPTVESRRTQQQTFLNDSDRDKLASRCPASFGPRDGDAEKRLGKTENDFDIIFAIDGNFQHSRDENAQHLFNKHVPDIFLPTTSVQKAKRMTEATNHKKAKHVSCKPALLRLHADLRQQQQGCSDSWKAADDGAKTIFKGKTDTGLFAIVCRHDVCLRLINIERSVSPKRRSSRLWTEAD